MKFGIMRRIGVYKFKVVIYLSRGTSYQMLLYSMSIL